MKGTFELRWFYHKNLTTEVRSWFCGSRLCKEEPLRTDRYLVLPGTKDVSVKIRNGEKLEIKARTKQPEPFILVNASVGLQDGWVKWSQEDRDLAGRLAALEAESPDWVPVAKRRWMRQFHLDTAGNIEEVDADSILEHGCRVEASDVTARESHWWTLAFESYGEGSRPTNLEQVARHFLKVLPHDLALTERDSMAYPEWLNRLTTDSR